MNRTAEIKRKTGETDISVIIDLDGNGSANISTGIGFFNHMLISLSKHSRMNITVKAKGDLHVDDHHTVEDTGICLGAALKKALGDKKGVRRFGSAFCPMDESLARAAIDLSGRAFFDYQIPVLHGHVGEFSGECLPEFFRAIARGCGMTLHLDLLKGVNMHHMVESLFKAFALALREAVSINENDHDIPSTKGVL